MQLVLLVSLLFADTQAEARARAAFAFADVKSFPTWPDSIPFPAEMKPYTRSKYTQEIAVTNGYDRISPVPRTRLEAKWHQSGGMEGVKDFRSDLYRYLPEMPEVWVGNISVLNSLGYFQDNRGWKINYVDGSKFMDVLSNTTTGDVFEIRTREKKAGKWQSGILYTNEKARPEGYKGLTVSCNSCHSQAGTGGYAVGLIPGGDTVISVGFRALER